MDASSWQFIVLRSERGAAAVTRCLHRAPPPRLTPHGKGKDVRQRLKETRKKGLGERHDGDGKKQCNLYISVFERLTKFLPLHTVFHDGRTL